MSFTLDVISELLDADLSKTCCRKAMLFGLFVCGKLDETKKNGVVAEFKTEESATLAAQILKKQFSTDGTLTRVARAGRTFYALSCASKALWSFIGAFDSAEDRRTPDEIVGFRCTACVNGFLRGAFIACGSINDPAKSYHLEFSLPNATRAERLSEMLDSIVPSPKTVVRERKIGLYYKSNEAIFALLNYIGGGQSSFLITNTFIERDIRNAENRATNCVASNISKSVDAAMRQVEAIRHLKESGKLLSLPEELRYTAELRMENPAASLFELSHLHEPPISKSGLNRRLTRLLEEANE